MSLSPLKPESDDPTGNGVLGASTYFVEPLAQTFASTFTDALPSIFVNLIPITTALVAPGQVYIVAKLVVSSACAL